MTSPSVSFRISRSTEDLAGTLHLLSQRLLQLEQRLDLMEKREAVDEEEDPAMVSSLANAERLLLDCRALLAGALEDGTDDEQPQASDLGEEEADSDVDSSERGWHTRSVA
jgi:hypothetical protein